MGTFDTTVTDMYDGSILGLTVWNDSVVNIRNGYVFGLGILDSGTVNLYAYDVVHHETGGHYDRGWIEGNFLENDLYFNFNLNDTGTFGHINIIPEPSTLLLLALGGVFLRRKKQI